MKSIFLAAVFGFSSVALAAPANLQSSQLSIETRTAFAMVEAGAGAAMLRSRQSLTPKAKSLTIRSNQIKAELNELSQQLGSRQNAEIEQALKDLQVARFELAEAKGAVAGYNHTKAPESSGDYQSTSYLSEEAAVDAEVTLTAKAEAIQTRIGELTKLSQESPMPQDQRAALLERQKYLMEQRTLIETDLAEALSYKGRRVLRLAAGYFLFFDLGHAAAQILIAGDTNFQLFTLDAAIGSAKYAAHALHAN